MKRSRPKARKTAQVISRRIDDANFVHVLRMFPLLHMWAGDDTELARACRDVAAGLDAGFPSPRFTAAITAEAAE